VVEVVVEVGEDSPDIISVAMSLAKYQRPLAD
jgi:hypothetical protein